jgi:hypothetical protein
MKRGLYTFFVFIYSIVLSGQSENEPRTMSVGYTLHKAGDVSVALSPDILFNTPNGTQLAGGLKLRMFIGKRFSFDTDLVLSRDYVHLGPGLIGIPIWISLFRPGIFSGEQENTLSDLLTMGLLMLLTAEHTAYHIPVKESADISPYVSAVRLKQANKYGNSDSSDDNGVQFCFAIGLEVNKYFKRFILSPYAEYDIGYSNHISGFNTGIYCGYYFPTRY